MSKKVKVEKKTRLVKVKDIGMDDPLAEFEIWDDPSRQVITTLLARVLTNADELTESDVTDYFEAVTRLIVASNIEGLEFDTRAKTIASFDHPDLPWGFMYEFIMLVVSNIITESEKLKKVWEVLSSSKDSGNANDEKEGKSRPE